MGIGPRQHHIYRHLQRCLQEGKPFPTYKELGALLGISLQAVAKHVTRLEEEGWLSRTQGSQRSFTLRHAPAAPHAVTVLGKIAAGQPIEALEHPETLTVPGTLDLHDGYALEVSGDSMIEDGIHDGDIVFIRRQTTAFNGQTVVAIVREEATLKRYYHEGDRIRLQPANARLSPLYIYPDDEFAIRGIVVGLFRRYP
jgi:repressor LexA